MADEQLNQDGEFKIEELQQVLMEKRKEEIIAGCKPDDGETQEEMEERAAAIVEGLDHVVRGAMLRCTCGTHCRRLNLPRNHGQDVACRPLMNQLDCVPGAKEICEDASQNQLINVSYFGICEKGNSKGPSITLKKDVKRDPFGNPIEKSIFKREYKIQSGHVCVPEITDIWWCPDKGTLYDGAYAITTGSFLTCRYGGIVEVLQSGQAMDDNVDPELANGES